MTGSSPLLRALQAITGETPPVDLRGIRDERELKEEDAMRLLEWASDHATPRYLTGADLLDDAAFLVGRLERIGVMNAGPIATRVAGYRQPRSSR